MGGRRSYRFGISRSHGGDQVLEGARLFSGALGAAIDGRVRLHVAFDYADLLRAFLDGTVEVAWLSPIVLVQALARSAHLAAVCERHGELTFRSALLVQQRSRFETVQDLMGCRAAWVEPSSASGHVLPRLLLTRAGVQLGAETFAGSFVQARALVERDEADVCATFVHGDAPNAPHEGLRILSLTESIPNEGIVLGAGLDEAERLRLTTALHGLHTTSEGELALRALFQAARLVAPTDGFRKAIVELTTLLRPATAR